MLHVFFHATFPIQRCLCPFQFDYIHQLSSSELPVSHVFYRLFIFFSCFNYQMCLKLLNYAPGEKSKNNMFEHKKSDQQIKLKFVTAVFNIHVTLSVVVLVQRQQGRGTKCRHIKTEQSRLSSKNLTRIKVMKKLTGWQLYDRKYVMVRPQSEDATGKFTEQGHKTEAITGGGGHYVNLMREQGTGVAGRNWRL